MKYLLGILLVIVAVTFSANVAFSGDADDSTSLWHNVDIRLNGGIAIPVAPANFANIWEPGFTAGGGIAFGVNNVIALALNANYAQFPYERGSSTIVSNLYVSAGARAFVPTNAVRPYFEAGLGFFAMGGEADDTAVGIHGGVGAKVSLVFLEALYILGFTDDESTGFVSIRAGVSIDVAGGGN